MGSRFGGQGVKSKALQPAVAATSGVWPGLPRGVHLVRGWRKQTLMSGSCVGRPAPFVLLSASKGQDEVVQPRRPRPSISEAALPRSQVPLASAHRLCKEDPHPFLAQQPWRKVPPTSQVPQPTAGPDHPLKDINQLGYTEALCGPRGSRRRWLSLKGARHVPFHLITKEAPQSRRPGARTGSSAGCQGQILVHGRRKCPSSERSHVGPVHCPVSAGPV